MSEVKVNKISPRTNCGTVTLGDSGDTFTIPAGATITNNGTANGFGATGAVNWQTGSVKTSGFTATSGEGYFVNTTGGAVSVNLPAGTAGAVVGFKDYAKTFDSNAVTLVQNGSDKIGGSTINATLSTEGQAVTLVFIDSTQGWLVTDSGLQSDASTATFITATGGTITTCGNFKVHKFTGPGTFTVCSVGNACGSNSVDYVVVAGGGSGGSSVDGGAGGGGAGGYREGLNPGSYTGSPLATTSLPVAATGYPITVGAGGASAAYGGTNTNGANSVFSTITSAGGGFGGQGNNPGPSPATAGNPGGSGGGGYGYTTAVGGDAAGTGNTPPVSPPQGNNGGAGVMSNSDGNAQNGGGGGGATSVGVQTTPTSSSAAPYTGGPGGAGATSSIDGTPTARAGGGGAGRRFGPPSGTVGTGGAGGGGAGGSGENDTSVAGTTNTGGGGGGGGGGGPSGTNQGSNGGSGIVIIRYKFQ